MQLFFFSFVRSSCNDEIGADLLFSAPLKNTEKLFFSIEFRRFSISSKTLKNKPHMEVFFCFSISCLQVSFRLENKNIFRYCSTFTNLAVLLAAMNEKTVNV